MRKSPCENCSRTGCKEKNCETYRTWFCRYWNRFQRYVSHNYWENAESTDEKLCYVHPDVIRRYLHTHPCEHCAYRRSCNVPCRRYLQWWNARMVWLKWKFENSAM